MLEELISETKQRHSKKPISQEVFSKWRSSAVTKRLFDHLELSVIDSYQDYLPDDPQTAFSVAKMREGGSIMVERVLDWSPEGCTNPNDEDQLDED